MAKGPAFPGQQFDAPGTKNHVCKIQHKVIHNASIAFFFFAFISIGS